MKKQTRILFFSLLTFAPITLILNQNYGRALLLLILLVMGAIIFEKREASRQFFRAIKKLLICVDYEAFYVEGEKIRQNAMLPWLTQQHYQLFQMIIQYHNGTTVPHISDSETGKFAFNTQEKVLKFWATSYKMLSQETRLNAQSIKELEHLSLRLPHYMKTLASERYMTFTLDLIDPTDSDQMDKAQRIRASLSAQLLLAEATFWLSNYTTDAKRAVSYKRTAENLSKGLLTRRI
jgi:hypothetical protein